MKEFQISGKIQSTVFIELLLIRYLPDYLFEQIHKWHQYQKFLKNISIAIFSRSDKINFLQKYPCWNFLKNCDHVIIRNRKFVMSSTQIRNNNV